MKYIALIRKEDETDYWVDVPDIPGCYSSGPTEEEALASFQDALELHLESLKADGIEIPPPRGKDEVLADEDEADYIKVCLVDVPI